VKRFIAVILILLFAANVSGATISYHFCGKIFQYFAFNGQKKKSKCCCGGSQEKKGCCKTKHCKVTVDEGKSFGKQIVFATHLFADAVLPEPIHLVSQDIELAHVSYAIPLAHSPPFIRTVHLYIFYQQFLI
jgi:hypothetical protein